MRQSYLFPLSLHMNIEKSGNATALKKYKSLFDSLHISDNNRFFLGHDAIDFRCLIRLLKNLGYAGTLAIEGNLKAGFAQDLGDTMNYLQPLLLNSESCPEA